MKDDVINYIETLISGAPQYVYVGLLSLFCIVSIFFIFKKKIVWKGISILLLSEYIFLLYSFMFLFRNEKETRMYDYTPFWSYDKPALFVENIMNIVVFVPLGLLLGCVLKGRNWWKVFLIGITISVSIEFFQLIFKRGFSEFDDVIHNTLGCMIGYGLFCLVRLVYEKVSKRRMAVL